MQNISYIEVDEKNGMLKVPNELAGNVACLLREKLGIQIEEKKQNYRISASYQKQLKSVSTVLIQYFMKHSLASIDQLKFPSELGNNKITWKHLYYLVNQSEIKEKFRIEWNKFLQEEAEKVLTQSCIRESIRIQRKKWISFMILENQKKIPYEFQTKIRKCD